MSVRRVKAGTTDVSVTLRIVDSTDGTPETGVVFNTSGIDLWYRREGAASTDITEATLSALTDAHSDGGFLHINDGWYRLDLPDAACAAGVAGVQIGGTVTGMVVLAPYIELDVNTAADVYGRVGAPAGASVSADIAAVKAETATIVADTNEVQISLAAGGLIESMVDDLQTEVDGIQADTEDIQSRLPAALVSGRIDASVGAMAANVMTAAAAAADLTTELQSGLATAAALDAVDNFLDTEVAAILAAVDTEVAAIKAVTDLLPDAGALSSLATQASVNTIDDFLDTEIAAIKAKTDSLTFTTAGMVDSAVKRVGDTTLTAAGTGGQGYGAA